MQSSSRSRYAYTSHCSPDVGPPKPASRNFSLLVSTNTKPIVQNSHAPADLNDPPTETSVIAKDLLTDRASQAILGADCEAGHCFFLCCGHKSKTHQRRSNTLKVYLASWHLSADTAANARKSKVIGGRFYDGFHTCETETFINLIPAGKWSASHVNELVDQRH